MPHYDPSPRTSGPPIVSGGAASGSAIVVFDPAGVAKHDDIPVSWQPLLDAHSVVWCRLPTPGALGESAREIDRLADRDAVVDVVTSGPAAETVMDFVRPRAHQVRSLLLVDPAAPDDRFPVEEAELADALWEERARSRIAELEQSGVTVRVIAHSTGGSRDRVDPPLPLGHPDLVEVIAGAVAELDAGAGPADPRR